LTPQLRPTIVACVRGVDVQQERIDRGASLLVVFGFSISLGVGIVAIPLLALASGYSPASVGFLVAAAAATQLAARLAMPWMLGRFPDRTLIALSSGLMLAAFGLLLLSTTLVVFVLAQVLQGAGRAIFWTGSQTHAVRDQPHSVRRLVDISVASNAGTLIGPALGGVLATIGLQAALMAGVVGAAGAAFGTVFLQRLEPFDRRHAVGSRRLLRRGGVDVACWASAASGVWMAILGSYVPVILLGAGIGSVGIGWLITVSEAAAAVALISLRRISRERILGVVSMGTAGTLAALVAVALLPANALGYAALLIVGGAASGVVTTLAPAIASLAAALDEQGDALSLSGTFRAAALFASPASVGALLAYAPLGAAITVVAVAVGLPGLVVGRSVRDVSRLPD
jgi:hypothetical protein